MRAIWSWLGQGGAVLAVLAVLGGCSDDQPMLSEGTTIELSEEVQQVREAATAGDVDIARARLSGIATAVENLLAGGEISGDDAARITAAADDVGQNLALLTTTTNSPPLTAPPPTALTPGETGTPDRPASGSSDDGGNDDDGDDDDGDDIDDDEGKDEEDDRTEPRNEGRGQRGRD